MKGILFKPWKRKAIRESQDKLWQTRRIIKIDHLGWLKCDEAPYCFVHKDSGEHHIFKPHYQVNEVVYIKEAWWCPEKGLPVAYKANLKPQQADSHIWKSSLFMPAWAARDFIKITDVSPERLKDITFEDCLAEGIVHTEEWQDVDYKAPEPLHPEDLSNEEADREISRGWEAYTQQAFAKLWDSINPKIPWENNPWVGKYSFRLL